MYRKFYKHAIARSSDFRINSVDIKIVFETIKYWSFMSSTLHIRNLNQFHGLLKTTITT